MAPLNPEGEIVFTTPWFQILANRPAGFDQPHYSIQAVDVVVIVAVNCQGKLLLVRQFRPAVDAFTLELPAGHIEPGETPEDAARKELWEETGHEAGTLELLTKLSPSTARFTNRLWCFFAADVKPGSRPDLKREAGIEPVFFEKPLPSLLTEKEFLSAPSHAALFAAVLRGKLKV
ncbi:MAG: NUDIX hydrolase [Verrucomicrobia bacterium]|nr:NUDIX hydrolase [Verrucomicrobiota bacterium]